MRRFIFSTIAGGVGVVVSFVSCYLGMNWWAEWRYPDDHNLAGLAAFFYSVPVGLFCGLVVFALTWRRMKATDSLPRSV